MQQRQSQFRTTPFLPPSTPVFQQETQPFPIISPDATPVPESLIEAQPSPLIQLHRIHRPSKKGLTRIVASLLTLLLAAAVFVIWFGTPATSSSSPSSSITQQSFGPSSQTPGTGTSAGPLHVYIIGSVKHPGVYTLPAGARVYQLLQAAGGALPQADLVSLNLAAPLTDGQEVYVLAVGESPPTYLGGVPGPGANGTATTQSGQLVNLNTATSDQMRTLLHVSSTTAQNIIAARPYTSIDQLLKVNEASDCCLFRFSSYNRWLLC